MDTPTEALDRPTRVECAADDARDRADEVRAGIIEGLDEETSAIDLKPARLTELYQQYQFRELTREEYREAVGALVEALYDCYVDGEEMAALYKPTRAYNDPDVEPLPDYPDPKAVARRTRLLLGVQREARRQAKVARPVAALGGLQ